ncbi:hypothetical protein Patl1_20967 [Pistacia atlantica]|uniref:Uncharacterized protein n=1 Tax=Pistacia atlantica TaxID=434234 RepID=A0ACC1BIS0_9ROSI|nr:hypothetical protein Patl1_20967 [Pistacia atlantica]
MELSPKYSDLNQLKLEEEEEEADSISSEGSSIGSLEPDIEEEVSNSSPKIKDPLQDMSSLLQQLPSKRGLSKHYQGKSQSFTSLKEVTCLEDLAKPENPYNKKLKSCKSYAAIYNNLPCPPNKSSSQRPSCSKTNNNIGNLLGNRRPPMDPHRSASTNSFSNQTALFA